MRLRVTLSMCSLLALGIGQASAEDEARRASGNAATTATRDAIPGREILAPASGPANRSGGWMGSFHDDGYGYRTGSSWLYPSATASVRPHSLTMC